MNQLYLIYAMSTLALFALALLWGRVRKSSRGAKHKNDLHVFLDLETLGVTPGSAIMVIAAYAVNHMGECVNSMQVKISRLSAEQYGTVDGGTLEWWSEQSTAAQQEAFIKGPRVDVPAALEQLDTFFAALPPVDVLVWGNAPTLDCTLLRDAFAATGKKVPWAFYQERDCRTLAGLSYFKQTMEFEGTPHVALHDAKHQARYTIATLRELLRY